MVKKVLKPVCRNCGGKGPLVPIWYPGANIGTEGRMLDSCLECQVQDALRRRSQTIALSTAQGYELERLCGLRNAPPQAELARLKDQVAGVEAQLSTALAMLRAAAELCLKGRGPIPRAALKKAVHLVEAKR